MAYDVHRRERSSWIDSPTGFIVRNETETTSSESSEESHSSHDERSRKYYRWSRGSSYGKAPFDMGRVASIATGSNSVKRVKHTSDDAYGDAKGCWERKALLSLDGGGIRGYYTLLVLKRLMQAIAKIEYGIDGTLSSADRPRDPLETAEEGRIARPDYENGFLPCHYFDYTCGTSVGGILATLLCRLRLSVPEAIHYYKTGWTKIAERIKSVDRILPPKALKSRCTKGLREALDEILEEQNKKRMAKGQTSLIDAKGTYTQEGPDLCKTVVLAVQYDDETSTQRPYLFRSYSFDSERSTTLNRNIEPLLEHITFRDVCLSTSAAPKYFKRHQIGDKKYLDGAIWMSNPSMELYREVISMNAHVDRPIYCLVSLGCGSQRRGITESALRAFSPSRVTRSDWLYDHERRRVDSVLKGELNGTRDNKYFRFEGPDDLREVRPSEWRTEKSRNRICKEMEQLTDKFCTPSIVEKIKHLAELLVDYRRQRAQTTHWENYVYVDHSKTQSKHQCPVCRDKTFERDAFITHIKRQHPKIDSLAFGHFRKLLEENRI